MPDLRDHKLHGVPVGCSVLYNMHHEGSSPGPGRVYVVKNIVWFYGWIRVKATFSIINHTLSSTNRAVIGTPGTSIASFLLLAIP